MHISPYIPLITHACIHTQEEKTIAYLIKAFPFPLRRNPEHINSDHSVASVQGIYSKAISAQPWQQNVDGYPIRVLNHDIIKISPTTL